MDFGGDDEIRFERKGRAGVITLTRPQALNALSHGMVRALARALTVWEDDPAIAVALIRGEGQDFFGYGAREAVVRALKGDPGDRAPFGSPASAEELAAAVAEVAGLTVQIAEDPDGDETRAEVRVEGGEPGTLAVLAYAHGWSLTHDNGFATLSILRPLTP